MGSRPVTRVFNFSAGPAVLPEEVLAQAAAEMLDWHGSGMSVMEMSHRGKEFIEIAAQAERDFRELLKVPSNYKVLFLQGGARLHFAAVPMNLLGGKKAADYIYTGEWSKLAIKEANRFCEVNVAASSEGKNFTFAPEQSTWQLDPKSAYVHYISNETIGGVEFHWIPDTGKVPLVADASSHILSRPLDVSKFGLIYAGAQKNIGPAGLTVVIVRDDLIGHARTETPLVFDYKAVADASSMLNTPPTFAWYMAGLVFKWLKKAGGLAAVGERNRIKAQALYAAIDASQLYENPIAKDARSWMNVTFIMNKPELDAGFLAQAAGAGLHGLKGHRVLGGMRASIYNAMPLAGVEALIAFMREFERQHA